MKQTRRKFSALFNAKGGLKQVEKDGRLVLVVEQHVKMVVVKGKRFNHAIYSNLKYLVDHLLQKGKLPLSYDFGYQKKWSFMV